MIVQEKISIFDFIIILIRKKVNAQVLDKKIELIQWLSTLEDKKVIDELLKFRAAQSQDWWRTLEREEQASIENGIKDAENGNVKSHTAAKNLYEKWL